MQGRKGCVSNKIMAQCWPLQVRPTAKSVLISLADHAGDDGRCWPSLTTLATNTCISRRAVVDAIKVLEAAQVITADRSNGRHTTYVVHPDRFKPLEATAPASPAPRPSGETGADAAPVGEGEKDSSTKEPVQMPHQSGEATSANAAPVSDRTPVQMPHGSEIWTGANAALTGADAAPPPVQMPHQPVQMPHSNHQEPSIEPSMNPQKGGGDLFQLRDDQHSDAKPGKKQRSATKPKFDAAGMDLPDWLDRDLWRMWCRDREARNKPLTEDAAKLSIRKLEAHRGNGFAPKDVIENAIANGWQGLHAPSGRPNNPSRRPTSHTGFSDLNYSEGIDEHGHLTA